MIIAHLSDLHVSHFGTSLTQLRGPAREAREKGWEEVRRLAGDWLIEARRAENSRFMWKDRLRLVDPDGVVHDEVKVGADGQPEAVASLEALQRRRVAVSAATLARGLPDPEALSALLAQDPDNGNLRFCAVAAQLRAQDPDWVLVTGDLTDDGVGFELIEAGLAPWIERGRLVVIPGNHDIYPSPPLLTASSARKSELDKRRLWGGFCARLGQPASGSFLVELAPQVLLVCLDSAHPPRIPGSASGMVQPHELAQLSGALSQRPAGELRLACLHHHIANPPIGALGSAPVQAGMRLRNAREVLDVLQEHGVEVVMNGHRHVGYRYHPAHHPLFLSAPSTTMGCRSGASPFYWRIALEGAAVRDIREVPIEALIAGRGALTA